MRFSVTVTRMLPEVRKHGYSIEADSFKGAVNLGIIKFLNDPILQHSQPCPEQVGAVEVMRVRDPK